MCTVLNRIEVANLNYKSGIDISFYPHLLWLRFDYKIFPINKRYINFSINSLDEVGSLLWPWDKGVTTQN